MNKDDAPECGRICFILTEAPSQSAPHHGMAAIWLMRRGFRVEIICREGKTAVSAADTPFGQIPMCGFPVGRNRLQTAIAMTRSIWKWRRQHESEQSRPVYYINSAENCAMAMVALAGIPSDRIIYHTQDFLEPGRHPRLEFFERRFARRAGHVISNEINRARALASLYRLGQMPTVVRTALPRDWPLPQFDLRVRQELLRGFPVTMEPKNAVLIMSQGAFSPVRCTAELLEAMAKLPPTYLLVMTGVEPHSASHRTCAEYAARIGVAERVLQLPHLPYDQVLAYSAACDMGVLLYPNDGIGNFYQGPGRLTSYIGVGLPFVTSNFPGLEMLCTKYGIGEPCDPTAPLAIADALRKLGDAPYDVRRQRADHIRQVFSGPLAYDQDAEKIEQVVRAAGSRAPGKRL